MNDEVEPKKEKSEVEIKRSQTLRERNFQEDGGEWAEEEIGSEK